VGTDTSGSKTLSGLTSEKANTIKVRAVDKAGNVSAVKTFTYYYDNTVPVITSVTLSPTTTASTYNASMPVLTWNVTEGNLKQVQVSINGGTYTSVGTSVSGSKTLSGLTSEKANTIKVQAVDKAGNVSSEKTLTYYLDNTAPRINSVKISPESTRYDNYNCATPVLTWNISDNTLKEVFYKINDGSYISLGCEAQGSKTIQIDGDTGDYCVTLKAVDKVGQTKEMTSNTYHYDNQPPTISKMLVGKNPGSHDLVITLYNPQDDTIYVDMAGSEYEIRNTATNETVKTGKLVSESVGNMEVVTVDDSNLEDGIYEVIVRLTDYAGNIAEYKKIWYRFDNVAYDNNVELDAEYDETDGNVILTWENLKENTDVKKYILYAKYGDSVFDKIAEMDENTLSKTIDIHNKSTNITYRILAVYTDGSEVLSNIVSLVYESEEADVEENETTYPAYTTQKIDTDEDGLEDDYEIWDFGSDELEADSDGDGFDDYYEVTILGENPTIYTIDTDSDQDGLTNLEEYNLGTNPYLKDTDFDGYADNTDSEPLKTDAVNEKKTSINAAVHQGIYDRLETTDSETRLYNAYSEKTLSIQKDEDETTLYFYDNSGNNNITIISNLELTRIYTYLYDESDNLIYSYYNGVGYSFEYDENGSIKAIHVNNQVIVESSEKSIIDNSVYEDELDIGEVLSSVETSKQFGNGQVIKTIKTQYKVDDNQDSIAVKEEYFSEHVTTPDYVIIYNQEGDVIEVCDYSVNSIPEILEYTYDDGKKIVTSSSGLTSESEEIQNDNTESTCRKVLFKEDNSELEQKQFRFETETKEGAQGQLTYVQSSLDTVYVESIEKNNQTGDKVQEIKNDERKIVKRILSSDLDRIKTVTYSDGVVEKYYYDSNGRVIEISKINQDEEVGQNEYVYDEYGQLIQETIETEGKCYTYTYDLRGNIVKKDTYDITTQGSMKLIDELVYNYEDNFWKDKLTALDKHQITYDENGNPIEYYNGMKFSWKRGTQLAGINNNIEYYYNVDGIRIGKTIDNTDITYDLYNGKVIREIRKNKFTEDSMVLWYYYNGEDEIIGFEVTENGTTKSYYYEKNYFGDVVAIYDENGVKVVEYEYDAWGNILDIKGCYAETIGQVNPYRYRSYYYDQETGFYYLQTRYYDPISSRFISADNIEIAAINSNVKYDCTNLYIYCTGDPVNKIDSSGMAASKKEKIVIIYDKNNFSRQAKDEKKYLVKKWGKSYTVIECPIQNAQEFKRVWNWYADGALYVSIIMHGGPNALGIGDDAVANCSLQIKDEDYTNIVRISHIKKAHIGLLRLLSCNAGHKDVKGNLMYTFKKLHYITSVYACDGSVSFYSGIKKNNYSPRLATNQYGFYKFAKELASYEKVGACYWLCKRQPTGFYYLNAIKY
jgi:RHS repeat-associated protein